jgi:hypothetical protein
MASREKKCENVLRGRIRAPYYLHSWQRRKAISSIEMSYVEVVGVWWDEMKIMSCAKT